MLAAQKWVVCEVSSRWVVALRVAFARLSKTQPIPRLYEVRTLGELSMHLDEHGCDLMLVQVGHGNLSEMLQLLTRREPRISQFVALLEIAVDEPNSPGRQSVADLLWEMGAADVVDSPRQLRGLLGLRNRLAAARGPITSGLAERQSFADWAWSTLPWQDL